MIDKAIRRSSLGAGSISLAWLALASLALVGCGSTVAPKQSETPAPVAAPEPAARQEQPPARDPAAPEPVPEVAAPAEPAPNLIPPGLTEPAVVALLLPLSGPHAALGQALQDAAFLALSEVGDPRLVLLPRDTGGTEEGAAAAAAQALAEGARLILGPVFRDAVRGAAGPARAHGVNVVAFSTDRSVAGDGVYLMGFTPEQQVARVLRYAADSGLTRFAALAPSSAYGYAVVQILQRLIDEQGLRFAGVEFYGVDGSGAEEAVKRLAHYQVRQDWLSQRRQELQRIGDAQARRELRRLRDAGTYGKLPYDALLLPEGGQVLRLVAPFLPYYDIDGVRLLGTGLWDDPSIVREPSLAGGWFAAPSPALANDFFRRFQAAYGERPPRIASLAYDAAALASVLASGLAGPRFDAETLTTASGFAGSDGIFRFGPDGIAQRGLAVLEVTPEGFRVVDPAPASFELISSGTRPGS